MSRQTRNKQLRKQLERQEIKVTAKELDKMSQEKEIKHATVGSIEIPEGKTKDLVEMEAQNGASDDSAVRGTKDQ